ncbi:50S ribosomal protein L10, partial [Candidatus Wolfebacteria bacterium]|nr:50S ribosomal protein L10 [Candidatus Wolfebacteria bacterium]
MLTKQQKIEKVNESKNLLNKRKGLIFVDFGKTSVSDMEKLRRNLMEFGAKLKVVKKKLIRIALE